MLCDFDAIVIGGGPAGSFAAYGLVRAGWRVLIVDGRKPGAGKTCGHCLNPRVFPLLQRAGLLARIQAISTGESKRLIVRLPNSREFAVPLSSESTHRHGLITPRHLLDETLLQAAVRAGADVLRPATANVWQSGEHGAVVECMRHAKRSGRSPRKYTTRFVIGADGLRSGVARSLGFSATRRHDRPNRGAIGVSFDLDLGDALSHTDRSELDHVLPRDAICMHLARAGYVGIVRTGDGGIHVGALIHGRSATSGDSRRISLLNAIESLLQNFEHALGPVMQCRRSNLHAAGPMPWRPMRVSSSVAALVGDAAGYVEPFTGEGLSWAFESADLLVRTSERGADVIWNTQSAARYDHAWRRLMKPRLTTCRLVAAMVRSPTVHRWLPTFFPAGSLVSRAMARQIGRAVPEFET